VIISGAVRAIRHPERYGPRRHIGGRDGVGQSRARGLTRAILDTFPVVKFGGATESHGIRDAADALGHTKDVESRPDSRGPRDSSMGELEVMDVPLETIEPGKIPEQRMSVASHLDTGGLADVVDGAEDAQPRASGSRLSGTPSLLAKITEGSSELRRPLAPLEQDDVVPAAIGRETCPICIVDFEEGDDLRLLPCEGKHKFHQECVDPWLLELSSSCPICRHDFLALETMLAGDEDDISQSPHVMDSPAHMLNGTGSSAQTQGRFSQYLRFVRRRQNRMDRQDERRHGQDILPTSQTTDNST